jgi:hypothetical protein
MEDEWCSKNEAILQEKETNEARVLKKQLREEFKQKEF